MARTPLVIPPEIRSRLRRLSLRTRRNIGDRGFGLHQSRNKGAGIEFAQYRAYEPGDEPRRIDWKLFARSDRFFVREAEEESPIALWVLIDASASMRQADRARPDWSRMDAAKLLALCAAQLALMQGDRFGWIVLRDSGLALADPHRGRAQFERMQIELSQLEPAGTFPATQALTPIWDRIGARDLVLAVSAVNLGSADALAQGRYAHFIDRAFRLGDHERALALLERAADDVRAQIEETKEGSQ